MYIWGSVLRWIWKCKSILYSIIFFVSKVQTLTLMISTEAVHNSFVVLGFFQCHLDAMQMYEPDKNKTNQTNMDFHQYALELSIYLQLYFSRSAFWSRAQSFSSLKSLVSLVSAKISSPLCLIVILTSHKSLLLHPPQSAGWALCPFNGSKTMEKPKWVSTA